jgi:translation initiation factor IF-2
MNPAQPPVSSEKTDEGAAAPQGPKADAPGEPARKSEKNGSRAGGGKPNGPRAGKKRMVARIISKPEPPEPPELAKVPAMPSGKDGEPTAGKTDSPTVESTSNENKSSEPEAQGTPVAADASSPNPSVVDNSQEETQEKKVPDEMAEETKSPEEPLEEGGMEKNDTPNQDAKPDKGAGQRPEAAGGGTEKNSEDTTDKKRRRKKKQKKSEPAKIIKLAVPPVVPNGDRGAGPQKKFNRFPDLKSSPAARGITPSGPGDLPGSMPVPEDLDGKERTRKDKRKKWAQPDTPKGTGRKKRSVERKDLYDGGGRGGRKGKRRDSRGKLRAKTQKTQITTPKAIKRRVKIDETIELAELAKRMGIKANEMIVKLMGMGVMATVNQTIDFDTAALVAAEFDYEVEKAAFEEDLLLDIAVDEKPEDLITRSPVVTIMGHVDHGKTSLLDVIRRSKITTGEAGGITQHIGAYSVETPNGVITFLDTPGHAAFTAMRSRGAQVTDLVVLVVAADDGVMPQTIEAINHSRAADVPVIVAVNKMDKPDADPERVMRELSEQGLVSEDWGGDVIFARVSAKTEKGIDELLEMILLQAEVLELKANPNRPASGHVVEARLDAGRGPVATVLVEQGTLRAGEPLVCGLHSGKIRAMIGDLGQSVTEAGPSTPVELVGLSGVPEAGDEFVALSSEKDAKQISEHRMQKERAKELAKKSRANLEKLFANMGADEVKELKLIIKADVHGSLEALNDSIMKLAQESVDIKIVHAATGAINDSDVSLAAVSDAIIIGFNVRPTPKVREFAREENIDMRFYDIIYNVINDIKAALTGLMPSTFHENILGRAEVRDTFVIPNRGTIAGTFVQDGKIVRGAKIRLLRDGVVKCDSIVASLRRFKDDVKEVVQGYECGIGLEKFNDIKVGDVFESYEIEERKASLEQIKE